MGKENNKTQNLRFIIVTALVGLVILGIAVWAITFVVNSGKKSNTASSAEAETTSVSVNTTPITSDGSAMPDAISSGSTEDHTDTLSTEPVAPETEGVVTTVPVSPKVAEVSSVPETGPEEILPLALVAGTSVAYLMSKRF